MGLDWEAMLEQILLSADIIVFNGNAFKLVTFQTVQAKQTEGTLEETPECVSCKA